MACSARRLTHASCIAFRSTAQFQVPICIRMLPWLWAWNISGIQLWHQLLSLLRVLLCFIETRPPAGAGSPQSTYTASPTKNVFAGHSSAKTYKSQDLSKCFTLARICIHFSLWFFVIQLSPKPETLEILSIIPAISYLYPIILFPKCLSNSIICLLYFFKQTSK